MEINKIIKARRQELGLTLKEVATALGIAESTVSRYESSDIQNMGIDKIEALAKILECSPAYLMGWESKSSEMQTIAAHKEDGDFTPEELDKIEEYKRLLLAARPKSYGGD